MSSTEENVCGSASGVAGTEARPADVLLALADRAEREEATYALDCAIADAVGTSKLVRVPTYTTSLDAAVTPEGDDVFWRSGHDGKGPDPSLFKAEVLVCRLPHPAAGFIGRAKTEAMARRAAELRARAALTKAGV